MSEQIAAGSWVQLHRIVLEAGERAPQVPTDTAGVPLELRVKGYLLSPARVGERAEIKTVTGRRLTGILEDPHPSYEHKYGRPIPELMDIGTRLRAIIREEGEEYDEEK